MEPWKWVAAVWALVVVSGCSGSGAREEVASSSSWAAGALTTQGHYVIAARHTNLCLAQTPEAARCQSGWWSQNWQLVPIDASQGLYMLKNRHTGQCLHSHADIDTGRLHMNSCETAWWSGQWVHTAVDSRHYQLRNRHSGYCVGSNAGINGGGLSRELCNTAYWSQHWEFIPAQEVNYTWAPYLASNCHAFAAPPEQGWYRWPDDSALKARCNASSPQAMKWLLSSTNEHSGFGGGTMWDIPPEMIGSGRMWSYAFHPKADGTFQLGFALDKVNHAGFEDRYTFVGFNDSFDINPGLSRPNVGQGLVADFRLGLFAAERSSYPGVGLAKNRVMVALAARWNNRTYYLEVNLWRDPEFDLCPYGPSTGGTIPSSICDAQGVYDRRASWTEGEAIYFHGGALSQVLGSVIPALSPNSGMTSFRIPFTELFKAAPWVQPPTNWSDVQVAGLYLGIETWGKGRVWFEVDNYRLYTTGQP